MPSGKRFEFHALEADKNRPALKKQSDDVQNSFIN
jgi:hypothetical protein